MSFTLLHDTVTKMDTEDSSICSALSELSLISILLIISFKMKTYQLPKSGHSLNCQNNTHSIRRKERERTKL